MTTQGTLAAHCDTKHVDENLVRSVEAPAWTKTWHPVSHSMLLDAMEAAVDAHSLKISRRQYAMNESGSRFFGVWDLEQGSSDMAWSIGFRSALDKSMAIGVTVGTRVFVCDNLSFKGDFIAFRRHTAGLTTDSLIEMAFHAMEQAKRELTDFQQWHEALALVHLTPDQAYIATYRLMAEGIIPGRSFHQLHELLYGNEGKYNPHTLWGQHEAATEILTRQGSLLTVAKQHQRLNTLMDEFTLDIETGAHIEECLARLPFRV
jgi:hypothetical protein